MCLISSLCIVFKYICIYLSLQSMCFPHLWNVDYTNSACPRMPHVCIFVMNIYIYIISGPSRRHVKKRNFAWLLRAKRFLFKTTAAIEKKQIACRRNPADQVDKVLRWAKIWSKNFKTRTCLDCCCYWWCWSLLYSVILHSRADCYSTWVTSFL